MAGGLFTTEPPGEPESCPFTRAQMDLEGIMLSEINQIKKKRQIV